MSELLRLRRAKARLEKLLPTIKCKRDADAIRVGIEHIDARLIDMTGQGDYRTEKD